MYPVSDKFMETVQKNTRTFYWTGSITTKTNQTYEFGNDDIVKGSGYITRQMLTVTLWTEQRFVCHSIWCMGTKPKKKCRWVCLRSAKQTELSAAWN